MPNLTEEAIQRRDEASRAFNSAQQRGSQFSRTPGRGALAAQIATDRQDLNERKFAQEKSKDAFDQAMKLSESERKAQEAIQRDQMSQQRLKMAESQLAVSQSLQQLKDLQAEMKLQDAQAALRDKVDFLKATKDLKPGTPDFDAKLTEAAALYPHASSDPFVQKRVGWLMEAHDKAAVLADKKAKDDAAVAAATAAGAVPTKFEAGGVTMEAPKGYVPEDPQKRLDHYVALRAKIPDKAADTSPEAAAKDQQFADRRAYLDGEITQLRQQVSGQAPAVVTAPVVSASLPSEAMATAPAVSTTAPVASPQVATTPVADPVVAAVPADITPDAHAALAPGSEFYFQGKKFIKQ